MVTAGIVGYCMSFALFYFHYGVAN
jgi:hypothetical protein